MLLKFDESDHDRKKKYYFVFFIRKSICKEIFILKKQIN